MWVAGATDTTPPKSNLSLRKMTMTTRLETLVCAVMQSGIVQPLHNKLSLRVFPHGMPAKMTLEGYDAFSAAYDKEVAERAVKIANDIARHIADIELQEIEQQPTYSNR
jgi:hypothetical protein